MRTLQEVQSYKNRRVILKFKECYYFDSEESELIFTDLMSWLWLAANSPNSIECSMYHPMNVIDKMWHVFLSNTRDYAEFCDTYLGKFIHHEPHTREEAAAMFMPSSIDAKPAEKIYRELSDFQGYVFDQLGSETLLRWFITFPHVYSPDELQRRTRPLFSQRGFFEIQGLRKLRKDELLLELSKTHHIAAYCGGPNCGPQCKECGGGGGGGPNPV
jgi:hypothetical protein